MTCIYAEVIGDPIAHSKSPLIHNFWLEKLGIDAEYRACHVRPENLAGYFSQRRADSLWRGCNITIPHKESVVPHLDSVDARALGVGAVNCAYRADKEHLGGINTDIDGIAEAVGGLQLSGRRAVVIGAGGAARAAFAFLAGYQGVSVTILARSPDKATRAARDCGLAAEVVPFEAQADAISGASLLINATQLGMTGQDAMPQFVLDQIDQLAGDALVFDMVYAPLETELLEAARRRNRKAVDGLVMLVGQAATAFEKFFDRPPPREHDAKLRDILTQ